MNYYDSWKDRNYKETCGLKFNEVDMPKKSSLKFTSGNYPQITLFITAAKLPHKHEKRKSSFHPCRKICSTRCYPHIYGQNLSHKIENCSLDAILENAV